MKRLSLICFLVVMVRILCAQDKPYLEFTDGRTEPYTVSFKEINNLILIPIRINDSDSLYFILDSGAEHVTLFGAELGGRLPIDTSALRQVKLVGAGHEDNITAYISPGNTLEIGPIKGINFNLIYISDDFIQFSELLSHEVHGILGAPAFQSFVIEADYFKRQITFYPPDTYKPKRRFTEIPVSVVNWRPFLDVHIELHPRVDMNTSLLVDLGESKPISLFLSSNEEFMVPYPSYYANLGKGLNGIVSGRVARIASVTFDKYILKDVLTAFPNEQALQFMPNREERNGSLGAGIIKQFISVFDLRNERIYLKRSGFLRQPFSYDRTGLILVAEGEHYDEFRISGVIEDSPAFRSGIKKNDKLLSLNGHDVQGMKLGEVLMLVEKGGRKVRLKILRDGEVHEYVFRIFRIS